jgi:hypothetical protein
MICQQVCTIKFVAVARVLCPALVNLMVHVYVVLTFCDAAAAALQEDYQAEPEEESEVRTAGQLLGASVWPQLSAMGAILLCMCQVVSRLTHHDTHCLVFGGSHALHTLQLLCAGCAFAENCYYVLLLLRRAMTRMTRERRRCACSAASGRQNEQQAAVV